MNLDFSQALVAVRQMVDDVIAALPNLVLAGLVLAVFIALAGFVRRGVRSVASRASVADNAATVLARLARWAVVAAGVLVAVSIVAPSMGAAELVGLLGIGTVAIGFAFQDILQNFLAGILILITHPFGVGDQIVAGDYEGTVEEIQTRATFLRTYDGRRVVIPNADLFTDAVLVNTAFDRRRSQYDAGIGYPDDPELAIERMVEAMRSIETVLEEPEPEVIHVELADSSVVLRARWWTASDQATVTRTSGRVIAAIKRALDEAGVDIPYPTRTVYFHDETQKDEAGSKAPAA